jgi:hypothetical protein
LGVAKKNKRKIKQNQTTMTLRQSATRLLLFVSSRFVSRFLLVIILLFIISFGLHGVEKAKQEKEKRNEELAKLSPSEQAARHIADVQNSIKSLLPQPSGLFEYLGFFTRQMLWLLFVFAVFYVVLKAWSRTTEWF